MIHEDEKTTQTTAETLSVSKWWCIDCDSTSSSSAALYIASVRFDWWCTYSWNSNALLFIQRSWSPLGDYNEKNLSPSSPSPNRFISSLFLAQQLQNKQCSNRKKSKDTLEIMRAAGENVEHTLKTILTFSDQVKSLVTLGKMCLMKKCSSSL